MNISKRVIAQGIFLLACALSSPRALAATIFVYPPGFIPGPGCSLREAVQSANTNTAVGGCFAGSATGTDTLMLALPRPYRLDDFIGSDEDGNASGDLDVTSPIIVQGVNTTQTVIVGQALDRVFDVHTALGNLTINPASTPTLAREMAKAPDGSPRGGNARDVQTPSAHPESRIQSSKLRARGQRGPHAEP